MSVEVRFTIPGKVTSANMTTRHVAIPVKGTNKAKWRAKALTAESARIDRDRIRSLALAAKVSQGWRVPDFCEVLIIAYNSPLDLGNIEKNINDGIKGNLLIVDDSRRYLRKLTLEHRDDHLGERYVVRVTALAPALPL